VGRLVLLGQVLHGDLVLQDCQVGLDLQEAPWGPGVPIPQSYLAVQEVPPARPFQVHLVYQALPAFLESRAVLGVLAPLGHQWDLWVREGPAGRHCRLCRGPLGVQWVLLCIVRTIIQGGQFIIRNTVVGPQTL
jgi:hypothetical protein